MARPQKLIPSYRKHRASGQAVCTVNGVEHYLGPHGTKASKLEYDRLICEWLASGRSASYGAPERDLTVSEMLADYIRHVAAYHGKGLKGEYPRTVIAVRPLKSLYGKSPAAEFGVLQFKAVRQAVATEGRSRGYVNELMRRIVAAFKWAAAEGKIPAAVPQNLAIVPGLRRGKCTLPEPGPIEPVDAATVDATLPYLPPIIADMVRLQRLTGCRPTEVCILRPCDLDRTGDVWLYRPAKHKTQHHGRDRLVLIGPKAQDVLLRYLARDHEAYCFRPCDSMEKFRAARNAARVTPLSCGNKPGSNRRARPRTTPGEQYDVAAYRRAITRACDKAFPHPEFGDIPLRKLTGDNLAAVRKWQSDHHWAPNQLRHAAATEVRREFGLEAAQIVLGHASAQVTQVYAERDLQKGLEVAKRIG